MNVSSLAVGLSIAVWQGVPPPAESGVSVGWALSELSKAAATASGDSGFARGLFSSSSGSVSQDSSDAVVMSSVAQPASECTGDAARGRSTGAGGAGGGGGGGAAGASSRDGLRMRPIKFMALPIRPLRSAVRGVSTTGTSSSFDVEVSPMSPKLARFGGILGVGLLVVGGGGGGGGGGGAAGAATVSALGDAAAGAAAFEGSAAGAGAGAGIPRRRRR